MCMITALICFIPTTSFSQEIPEEIVGKRTMNSSVYHYSNGTKEAVISVGPIHYLNGNTWEPINQQIVNSNEINNGFENTTNVFQTFFPLNATPSSHIKIKVSNNHQILMNMNKTMVTFDPLTGLQVVDGNINSASGIHQQNKLVYSAIHPGISDVYEVLNGALKNTLMVDNPPYFQNTSTPEYYGFQETFTLPLNWTIASNNLDEYNLTESSLYILDEFGEHRFTIPAPLIEDNNKTISGISETTGKFLLSKNPTTNTYTLSTLVSTNWLMSPNRTYPVSIDPTVVLNGTDGGWLSPVNFLNSNSYAFTGFCCGNETHHAWIKFNLTSIPDASCVTKVETQLQVTFVGGNASEQITINNVTGAFGPYPGITPAAYADLGNGLYNSFNVTTVGTYGYYDLGGNAVADVQSRLVGNGFQYGLMMTNEFSTNYKRIDALQARLRVTYDNPPCIIPLPILLSDFTAAASGDIVHLNWQTTTEMNNDYFTLERSSNGSNWTGINKIAGAGNSSTTLSYSTVDLSPLPGVSYYRLKQTDYDGRFSYSTIEKAVINTDSHLSIYPNPTKNILNVSGEKFELAEFLLVDVLGKDVTNLTKQITINTTHIQIDLSQLKTGIYYLKTQNAIEKVIKQ